MSRTIVTALAVTAAALLAGGTPAVANTVVVGYTTVDADYSAADGEDPTATIRAQGLVVDDLEPRGSEAASVTACPPGGCRYALMVVDPAAVRDDAEGPTEGAGCDTRRYGIVDANPDERDVGGAARVYTGTGAIPASTVGDAGDSAEHITPGVGLLCFANPAHDDGLHNEAGDGLLVATQPAVVVIVYDPRRR